MSELTYFSNKLAACDLIVLTPVGEDRLYCRFFFREQYLDRIKVVIG